MGYGPSRVRTLGIVCAVPSAHAVANAFVRALARPNEHTKIRGTTNGLRLIGVSRCGGELRRAPPVYDAMVYEISGHRTHKDAAEEVARLSNGDDAVRALMALSQSGRYCDLELRHDDAPDVVLFAWRDDEQRVA